MSDQPAWILHIRRANCARGDEVARRLGEGGVAIVNCSDVYCGLAKLGKAATKPVGVLVSVDVIDALEFEFFSLATRLSPGVPLLVYGRAQSESKIEQALLVGASGRATDLTIRELLDWDEPDRHDDDEFEAAGAEIDPRYDDAMELGWQEFEQVGATEEAVDDQPEQIISTEQEPELAGRLNLIDETVEAVELEEGVDEVESELPEEGDDPVGGNGVDESTHAARVPWLRYAAPDRTGPTRVPPGQRDGGLPPRLHPVPIPRDEPSAAPVVSPGRESLLTPEELAALLGDEYPAFQNKEPRRERGAP